MIFATRISSKSWHNLTRRKGPCVYSSVRHCFSWTVTHRSFTAQYNSSPVSSSPHTPPWLKMRSHHTSRRAAKQVPVALPQDLRNSIFDFDDAPEAYINTYLSTLDKPTNLLILPQEVRDSIFDFAFPAEPDINRYLTRTQWDRRQQELQGQKASYVMLPFPTVKVDLFLVSRAFFVGAAERWVRNQRFMAEGGNAWHCLAVGVEPYSGIMGAWLQRLTVKTYYGQKRCLAALPELKELTVVVGKDMLLEGDVVGTRRLELRGGRVVNFTLEVETETREVSRARLDMAFYFAEERAKIREDMLRGYVDVPRIQSDSGASEWLYPGSAVRRERVEGQRTKEMRREKKGAKRGLRRMDTWTLARVQQKLRWFCIENDCDGSHMFFNILIRFCAMILVVGWLTGW